MVITGLLVEKGNLKQICTKLWTSQLDAYNNLIDQ